MIIHFSCGATSAIAGAIALKTNPDAEIIYADTGAEHPDNARFMADCEEKLFKKKVTVLKNLEYDGLYDLLEKKKFVAGIHGAPCTTELKKTVIRDYLGIRVLEEDHVFGFDVGEPARIEKYKVNNPEIRMVLPLISHGLSKANCLALLMRFEIEIPAMYKLGYSHSNCIGCVKGGKGYWAAIREDFPEIFNWMAKHERNIGAILDDGTRKGASINRISKDKKTSRLFLDEMPSSIKPDRQFEISCGYTCGMVGDLIEEKTDAKGLDNVDGVFWWMT